MQYENGWRAEVLTPNSLQQAMEYANIRRAQSPDGRFTARYLRNSEYTVDKGWSDTTKWFAKIVSWVATAAITGVIAAVVMG